jgi:hypothetical protein
LHVLAGDFRTLAAHAVHYALAVSQSPYIADMFLALSRGRHDARERAKSFLSRLETVGLWEPEEIDELRLIAEGLAAGQ